MSVINPLWLAEARRQWPLVGAIILFIAFMFVHQFFFSPTAARYERALARATELGLALDPNDSPQVVPPRVFALLTDNAMDAREARRQGDSGALGASLLADLSEIVRHSDLEIVVAEPGATTQQNNSVVARAHLRLRGSYDDFVAFLGSLATDGRLYGVDRFSVQPTSGRDQVFEIWLSRYILKQSE